MRPILKKFSVLAGFAVLAIVLIVNGFVTRRQVSIQVSNNYRVIHTRQVLFELEQTESILKDAETGQRGFLYTGDSKYLRPYNDARTQIASHIDSLTRLTSDDPRQQAWIAELRGLVHDKLAELDKTVTLYQAGQRDAARTIVLSDYGLITMTHIRDVVRRMEAEENSLEGDRLAAYQKSVQMTIGSVYLASSLALLGLLLLAYAIVRQMNLREQHATELRAREEWFRVTLTSIGDGVIATDKNGKVTFLNTVAESLIGISLGEARGRDITDVFPIFNEFTGAVTENPVEKVMENGRVVGLANHTVLKHADGRFTPIEDSAAPIRDDDQNLIGVVLVFRDASIERQTQELLRRSEKLSAAARLSATVAHEINNPLEAVGNLIYIAKLSPGASQDVIDQLTLAEHELERVAHITRQTLGFYRESSDPEPTEIAPIVESVLSLYSNKLMAKRITVQRNFQPCPPIMAVAGELRQAVSNLISNAVDAVGSNGTIQLTTQCIEAEGLIEVIVDDNGPGIAEENIERIFEPFFTTKKDVGTGLGLWVTKEIIERHGGEIVVDSRKESNGSSGASFAIRLPFGHDWSNAAAQPVALSSPHAANTDGDFPSTS
jgi:PAS domain S-box-containing protein